MRMKQQDIKRLCNAGSYERGVEYLRNGNVVRIEYYGDTLKAKVAGTSMYEVKVNLENGIKASCTCPYDWGGYCKHIVATLLYLSEHHREMEEAKVEKEGRISQVLDRVSIEDLKGFLLSEFKDNPALRTHFLIRFSDMKDERSIEDYKKEIRLLYLETAEDDGFVPYGSMVDFSPLRDLAGRYIEMGNPLEGAKINRALSEGIAERMSEIDDSDGFFESDFSSALCGYVACIENAGMKFHDKKEHIDYLFARYIENEPDFFQGYYEDALLQLCPSEQELEYVMHLLKPHIPGVIPEPSKDWYQFYQSRRKIALKLNILEKLERKEDIFRILEGYWKVGEVFCLAYVRMLKAKGKMSEAVTIAENGLRWFPAHLTGNLHTFLNRYYKKQGPQKYRNNLIELFYQTGDWKHYDTLKKYVSEDEWQTIVQEMVVHLADTGYFVENRIIDIYLREKLHDQALRLVLEAEDLDVLASYHRDLSDEYPEEYFSAYQTLIGEFVETNKGRSCYRRAVKLLKKMRSIKGLDDRFETFMKLLREKYRNRRAFLDEIKGL